MTAVLGWAGVPCSEQSQIPEVLERMAGSSFAHQNLQVTDSGNTLIAAHRYHGNLICCQTNGWHLVFAGNAHRHERGFAIGVGVVADGNAADPGSAARWSGFEEQATDLRQLATEDL